jgi:hypothetical protein
MAYEQLGVLRFCHSYQMPDALGTGLGIAPDTLDTFQDIAVDYCVRRQDHRALVEARQYGLVAQWSA